MDMKWWLFKNDITCPKIDIYRYLSKVRCLFLNRNITVVALHEFCFTGLQGKMAPDCKWFRLTSIHVI